MEKLNILTIIPVRSGSKRLKNKNIKMLNNKPLMAYSIQAGLGSRYTHDVIVSTDSTEYAKIAKDYGALTPFIRPKEISLDSTSTYEVLEHAINFYKEQNKIFTYILLLQATSPLRESKHIDSAIELALYKNADCVISVCECDHPKEWSNVLGEDLSLDNFIDKKFKEKEVKICPKIIV
ncbi:acylneuraminate cytidylyltransferase family protein [Helicobacter equorum]|uniref:acylneuraminate cytidylyltransferase family protein n=1 Tax=Helicobacter equorum TaxID=361872 RepID=UPI001F2CFEB4|nr:acylneuraminate cytidylyltransferase family protein [Helicobacter equorum]